MIELRNLYRYFGSTRAVDNISFEVGRGEVFGYIGPNGAGKTTSMRILSTLDLPTSGDAYVDGFSVIDDPDRVRRRLGYMPDSFGAYPNVNVSEYLDFYARAYSLRGSERTKAVSKVMSFTMLDRLAEKPINGLSKGMKQRLCLGRALIHDPSVLVLDEPAAGLDPRARIELREMIGRLAADGKAILISSHILTELGEMCNKVGIIEQGRLIAVGKVDDIRRGVQAKRAVRVRLLAPNVSIEPWLTAREQVGEVRSVGAEACFVHEGDEASEAGLLRDLIGAGFAVVEFNNLQKSLEEVFMHVTRGAVQ